MSNYFKFNNIDMSSYDLELLNYPNEFFQDTESLQARDRAWGLTSKRMPQMVSFYVGIKGSGLSDLLSNLDDIKQALNQVTDCKLEIASITDRYWMARFSGMIEEQCSAKRWKGMINFILFDNMAYDNTEEDNNHTINEDPESFTETNPGTGNAKVVITLTCDDDLGEVTIGIENLTSGELFEWTGEINISDVLVIDCETMQVTLNDVVAMTGVDGRFIQLLPGNNSIEVTGFSGNLNFTYRPRYI
jgi:phage-related protein